MQFESVSECELSTTVTVTATNNSALTERIYLPALSNFVYVIVGTNSLNVGADVSPFLVPPGQSITMAVLSPATTLTTVFYQYAVEQIGSSSRYCGYFAITTRSPLRTMQVLTSEKNKKWYNYSATEHALVYYKQGVAFPVSGGVGSTNLVMPIHVVPDPATEKAYIYSSTNGAILYTYTANKGSKPFAYKKITATNYYNYTDLSGAHRTTTGNALKSRFSPSGLANKYSAKFNGINSFLETDIAAITFNSDDFTIECWIYPRRFPAFDLGTWASTRASVAMLVATANIAFGFGLTQMFVAVDGKTICVGLHNLLINTWAHVAFVRKNNAIMIFINGVEIANSYYDGAITIATFTSTPSKYKTVIGSYEKAASFFNGYIANLQILKLAALYTSSYTVPTTGYTNTAATIFSLGLDPAVTTAFTKPLINVVDASSAIAKELTVNAKFGGVVVDKNLQPFNTPVVNGGSVIFAPPVGINYLIANQSTASDFDLTAIAFTIEFWVFPSTPQSGSNTNGIASFGSTVTSNWYVSFDGTGSRINFLISNRTFSTVPSGGATDPSKILAGRWHHVAISTDGSVLKMFVNGILTRTYTGVNINNGTVLNTDQLRIGIINDNLPYAFNGYISNFRIVKSYLYSGSSLTVPTAAFTSSTPNTVFLLKAEVSQIVDTVGNSIIQANDNTAVAVTTTVTNFSGAALELNRAALIVRNNTASSLKNALNSTDVVIEWWMNMTNSTVDVAMPFTLGTGLTDTNLVFAVRASYAKGKYSARNNNVATNYFFTAVARTVPNYGVWNHYAIVKSGNKYKFYLNGNLEFITDYKSSFTTGLTDFFIGGDGTNSLFTGYIDGFVIRNTVTDEIASAFTPTSAFVPSNYSVLALDFSLTTLTAIPPGAAIDNSVFLLTTDGYLNKIEINNTSNASPKLPAPSSSAKKSNWFISAGLSFEEDVPFVGSFATAALLKKQQTLAPGVTCVDYFDGEVFVGGNSGIYVMDADTLTITSTIPLPFTIVSIKAYTEGFIVTSLDHKIYYLTPTGIPRELYSSTVLGLPDTLDFELFVPEPERSRLVVIDLTNDFTVSSAVGPSRYLDLDSQFAPAFVAVDVVERKIFVCGHDSDIVYYTLGDPQFNPIPFDNKVAWVSASNGSLIASYYLIDQTILNVAALQRPALITQAARVGPTGALIGTAPHHVKMIGNHNSIAVTVPGYSNSTTQAITSSSALPTWVQNFQNSKIYVWANGVRDQLTVAHNDYVSTTYQSIDVDLTSIRIPYVVGDRSALYNVSLVNSVAYPKNIFSSKIPAVSAFATDLSTVMLLHFNDTLGTSFFTDDATSSPAVYISNGTVAISNVEAKFEGLSVKFTSGSIVIPANTSLGFGTGNFTVEMWVKVSGGGKKLFVPASTGAGKWMLYINSAGAVVWSTGSLTIDTGTVTVTNNAWHHIAVTRTSGNLSIFVDGIPMTLDNDATNYSPAGTVVYSIGGNGTAISGIGNFDGYMDELRVSNSSRYTTKFVPGVPGYAVSTPVHNIDSANFSVSFDSVLYRLGIYSPVAALEYGKLYVNGILYDGTWTINTDDNITVDFVFNSTHSALAPILTIGKKEFALPVNTITQDLADNSLELANLEVNTATDYVGQLVIAAAGEYYVPNYSTKYITAIKRNGTALTPGSYVTIAAGDAIDLYGWTSSARMNDTVDIFLIGPKNYQISAETVKTFVPKFMDFGTLQTKDNYSADPLVAYGYTTVGSIIDPFVRFQYKSGPVTVTGIPLDPATGLGVEISLTTDQAYAGVYLIKTTAAGVVTQGTQVNNVVNGDTIQIFKRVLNYFETAVNLQVVFIDSDTGITDFTNVGKWKITPITITNSDKIYNQILDNPVNDFDNSTSFSHVNDYQQDWEIYESDAAVYMYQSVADQTALYGWDWKPSEIINWANLPFTWDNERVGGVFGFEIPFTWSTQLGTNVHYADRPYEWSNNLYTVAHLAERPYTWAVNTSETAHGYESVILWSKDYNTVVQSNGAASYWAIALANLQLTDSIKLFTPDFTSPIISNQSNLGVTAKISRSLVISDTVNVPSADKVGGYIEVGVDAFGIDSLSTVLDLAPLPQFKPSHTYGVTDASAAKFLESATHAVDQYLGKFFPTTNGLYGLAGAPLAQFKPSHVYGSVTGSLPVAMYNHVYGLAAASKSAFLPSTTLGLENMRTPVRMSPMSVLLSNFSNRLTPLSIEYGVDYMATPAFLPHRMHGLETRPIAAFLPHHTHGLETRPIAAFLPHHTHGLETRPTADFISSEIYGVRDVPTPTFAQSQEYGIETIPTPIKNFSETHGFESDLPQLAKRVSCRDWPIDVPLPTFSSIEVGLAANNDTLKGTSLDSKIVDFVNPFYNKYLAPELTSIDVGTFNRQARTFVATQFNGSDKNFSETSIIIAPSYNNYIVNLVQANLPTTVANPRTSILTSSNQLLLMLANVNTIDVGYLKNKNSQYLPYTLDAEKLSNAEAMQSLGAAVDQLNAVLSSMPYDRLSADNSAVSQLTPDLFINTPQIIEVAYNKLTEVAALFEVKAQLLRSSGAPTVAVDYAKRLSSSLEIAVDYTKRIISSINASVEYNKSFNSELNIAVTYLAQITNNINIAVDYLIGPVNLAMVGGSDLYKFYQPTEINVVPYYTAMSNAPIMIVPNYAVLPPTKILAGLVPLRSLPTVIRSDVRYEVAKDLVWDLNNDYSLFGAFATSAAATDDATAKNYTNFTIRQILNSTGAIYYSYYVNQNNDFVCGISAPKVPQSGLIKGG
jgi:hypothetical protein